MTHEGQGRGVYAFLLHSLWFAGGSVPLFYAMWSVTAIALVEGLVYQLISRAVLVLGRGGVRGIAIAGAVCALQAATANLRGVTLELTYEASGGPCSNVIFAQTIDSSHHPRRVDTDPEVTGTDSPFYNCDPKTQATIRPPRGGTLGQPGDRTGTNHATFSDTPLRYPSDATTWEVCALCCDSGTRLERRRWHYRTRRANRPLVNAEGEPVAGDWEIEDATSDFSDDAKKAYRKRLEEYVKANPRMARDPCVAGVSGDF